MSIVGEDNLASMPIRNLASMLGTYRHGVRRPVVWRSALMLGGRSIR